MQITPNEFQEFLSLLTLVGGIDSIEHEYGPECLECSKFQECYFN